MEPFWSGRYLFDVGRCQDSLNEFDFSSTYREDVLCVAVTRFLDDWPHVILGRRGAQGRAYGSGCRCLFERQFAVDACLWWGVDQVRATGSPGEWAT